MSASSSSLALVAAAGAAVSVPASTLAQGSSGTLEEIQVTGSRIKRQDLEGVGPVTVFDAQDIQATGVTSTETLLQRFSASAGLQAIRRIRTGPATATALRR